ncbi:prolyl oligopeptidase family serine peptidase [Nocardia sp. NPDC050710]|uniref:alpha/beta hydrolase family protein n=1 Tax=Nocardia sp. NPDC050710 TaxID=3157220 RepID=UPI0033DC0E24
MTARNHINRRRRLGSALLIAAAALTAVPAVAIADHSVPEGLGFYTAPEDRIPGPHGSLIWTRTLTGDPGLPGARNQLVLYRSVDVQGRPIAVSGTVAVPATSPPEDGWPLISWAHGTTGVADMCAPSRDTGPDYPAHDYTALVREVQARWIAAGYAVAQTDYQGLGTPGPHGYLIGAAEQRAVTDIALAARELDPSIGTRWVAVGHSQGGQAAIFTAAQAQQWAPRLQLLGSVALAPASHTALVVELARISTAAGVASAAATFTDNATAFLPLLIRGAQTVAEIDPARFLTPRALGLLPTADNGCIGQLRSPDEWGGLPAGTVFTATGDTGPFSRVLYDNDPGHLRFGPPLLVLQGGGDTTVPPAATDAMVAEMRLTAQPVDYRTYPGVDHRAVLDASYRDVFTWTNARFGR